jgi:hypothetical protein
MVTLSVFVLSVDAFIVTSYVPATFGVHVTLSAVGVSQEIPSPGLELVISTVKAGVFARVTFRVIGLHVSTLPVGLLVISTLAGFGSTTSVAVFVSVFPLAVAVTVMVYPAAFSAVGVQATLPPVSAVGQPAAAGADTATLALVGTTVTVKVCVSSTLTLAADGDKVTDTVVVLLPLPPPQAVKNNNANNVAANPVFFRHFFIILLP